MLARRIPKSCSSPRLTVESRISRLSVKAVTKSGQIHTLHRELGVDRLRELIRGRTTARMAAVAGGLSAPYVHASGRSACTEMGRALGLYRSILGRGARPQLHGWDEDGRAAGSGCPCCPGAAAQGGGARTPYPPDQGGGPLTTNLTLSPADDDYVDEEIIDVPEAEKESDVLRGAFLKRVTEGVAHCEVVQDIEQGKRSGERPLPCQVRRRRRRTSECRSGESVVLCSSASRWRRCKSSSRC